MVSSGKSASTSCTLIPPARYSRTSRTVIRMPRMHGWPLRLPGYRDETDGAKRRWSTAGTKLRASHPPLSRSYGGRPVSIDIVTGMIYCTVARPPANITTP
jgi:hypothetical protein